MRPPFKSNNNNQSFSNSSSSASELMINNNLWVGNLSADVTDSDLRNLFEKHGAVDSVTCYPTRSYAFVNMKRPEDAKRAKESLQGLVLRGGSLKIDFAKPVCITLIRFSFSTNCCHLYEYSFLYLYFVDFFFMYI